MERRNRARYLFFHDLSALYAGFFLFLRTMTLFDTGGRKGRLFSADDLYYVTRFFSAEMNTSPRIVKHPLLIVFGYLFTRAEALLLGAVGLRRHYQLIMLMQLGAALLSSGFLDRILERRYQFDTWHALLVCAVYALSLSVLFYTFTAESYILPALVLTASYWYAGERRTAPTVMLGVLAAGVTIPNAARSAARGATAAILTLRKQQCGRFLCSSVRLFSCWIWLKRRRSVIFPAMR